MATIAIVGDSYVGRLYDFMALRSRQHFKISGEIVQFLGLSGGVIRGRKPVLPLLTRAIQTPSMHSIVLLVGGNDACDAAIPPLEIARDLMCLVRYVLSRDDTIKVIVCQLTERRHKPDPGYISRIRAINGHLKRQLADVPRSFYVRFKGLRRPAEDNFVPDGVHLNDKGHLKLYRGIRGALLRALKPERPSGN